MITINIIQCGEKMFTVLADFGDKAESVTLDSRHDADVVAKMAHAILDEKNVDVNVHYGKNLYGDQYIVFITVGDNGAARPSTMYTQFVGEEFTAESVADFFEAIIERVQEESFKAAQA